MVKVTKHSAMPWCLFLAGLGDPYMSKAVPLVGHGFLQDSNRRNGRKVFAVVLHQVCSGRCRAASVVKEEANLDSFYPESTQSVRNSSHMWLAFIIPT